MKIAIIGAGIGGLTAALALRQVGVEATVFERAPQLREVGAGLAVWSNALRALDRLGVGDRIREISRPMREASISNPHGRTLSTISLEKLSQDLGQPDLTNLVMHRADLHRILLEALPSESVVTDSEVVDLKQNSQEVIIQLKKGGAIRADYLIGADGLRSVIRAKLWKSKPPRYSGQVCFRGVAKISPPQPGLLQEVQGAGERFGIAPLDDHRVYWFAAHNSLPNQIDDPHSRRAKLLARYGSWAWKIRDLLEATDEDKILRDDLVDRPPLATWTNNRVTLLGDAAHPSTPNLGQGAAMAIEDAFVLARLLAEHQDWNQAVRLYERERMPRTTKIVELSRKFGALACWASPWMVRLREWSIRMTPERMTRNVIRDQITYDVGHLPQNRKKSPVGV